MSWLGAGSSTVVPTIRGIALTDLSAGIGAVVWGTAVLSGGLGTIERALALAPLVLVPLGLGMAATPPFQGRAGALHAAAVRLQPIGAVLLFVSLGQPSVPAALLALPWVAVAGLLALAALVRFVERGLNPLPETAVDAGLAYTVVGAVALVQYHFGLTLWFEPVIVLLTAVHFHYAGFALPLVTGLAGRSLAGRDGSLFGVLTAAVVAGPAVIAVGISFSPLVEVVAVGAFTAAVALLGGYVVVRVAPSRPRTQAVLVAVSAAALPVSMLLALGYGVATFSGLELGLSISRMVALHGSLNAFGFGLVGMVGWRLAVPGGET